MWIADHLRGIDNPRTNLCIRWQGHATSCMSQGRPYTWPSVWLADSWTENR
jgi:hypothetical protein